ncbi:transposase, partial [Ferrimonas pelagia]|uniref:transposase n=1 Tax=Ferrimonas pelagia TaxID=1177826 RepID=UPI0031EB2BB8
LSALKFALKGEKLVLPKGTACRQWQNEANRLGRVKWQLFSDKPYSHGRGAVKYLARYMRGGALRDSQLLSVKDGRVRFRYRSHRSGENERMSVPLAQFVRQLLSHQALPGKPTVRYYGLYHPSQKERLNDARARLRQEPVAEVAEPDWQAFLEQTGYDLACSICGSKVLKVINKM